MGSTKISVIVLSSILFDSWSVITIRLVVPVDLIKESLVIKSIDISV